MLWFLTLNSLLLLGLLTVMLYPKTALGFTLALLWVVVCRLF